MGAAMKHPAPDQVKPSFVIFDIRALWHSRLSVRVGVKGLKLNTAQLGLSKKKVITAKYL